MATSVLRVLIKADAKGFTMTAAGVQAAAVSMGAAVSAAAGAAAVAFGYLIKRAAEYGDDIAKAATKTGLSTDALQEYRHAAELANIDAGTLENGIVELNRMLGEGADMATEDKEALSQLGLTLAELQGLNAEQLFERVGAAIAGVQDPMKRTAITARLLGRSGKELQKLFAGGAADFMGRLGAAKGAGLIIDSKNIENLDNLNDGFTVFITKLKQATFGGIGAGANELTKSMAAIMANQAIWDALAETMKSLTESTAAAGKSIATMLGDPNVVKTIQDLARWIQSMADGLDVIVDLTSKAVTFSAAQVRTGGIGGEVIRKAGASAIAVGDIAAEGWTMLYNLLDQRLPTARAM